MGHTFFRATIPRIAKALERIADEIEKYNTPVVENKEIKKGVLCPVCTEKMEIFDEPHGCPPRYRCEDCRHIVEMIDDEA